MAKIERAQASILKSLMQDEAWVVVEQALANRISRIQGEPINGSNEFETLRMLHRSQGAVDALTAFFEDLEKLVFDD